MRHITVTSREEAFKVLDKIFPTDYSKHEMASKNAGYDIYASGTMDARWADLGCRFEIILDGIEGEEDVTIWIKEDEQPAKAKISADLYRDLWMLINSKLEKAKSNENIWHDNLCEADANAEFCAVRIRKYHKEVAEYTELLERFENEIADSTL